MTNLSDLNEEQLRTMAIVIMFDLRGSWGYNYIERLDFLEEVNRHLSNKDIDKIIEHQRQEDRDGRYFRSVDIYANPYDINCLPKEMIRWLQDELVSFHLDEEDLTDEHKKEWQDLIDKEDE